MTFVTFQSKQSFCWQFWNILTFQSTQSIRWQNSEPLWHLWLFNQNNQCWQNFEPFWLLWHFDQNNQCSDKILNLCDQVNPLGGFLVKDNQCANKKLNLCDQVNPLSGCPLARAFVFCQCWVQLRGDRLSFYFLFFFVTKVQLRGDQLSFSSFLFILFRLVIPTEK